MICLALALAMVSSLAAGCTSGRAYRPGTSQCQYQHWKGGITCGQGRRIVERRGFRNVRARSCQGRIFVYSGRRRGDIHRIEVRRRDGRIISIRRR